MERLERDVGISVETVALFIRFSLMATPCIHAHVLGIRMPGELQFFFHRLWQTMPVEMARTKITVKSSPTMDGLSARRSDASVATSKSRIFTFTTFGTKAQAAYSRPDLQLSKCQLSLATKIGRCSAGPPSKWWTPLICS